jgi:hypothetical protein
MILHLFPKVRIHSWGGFGSQLNALGLAYNLSNKLPKRRIELIFRIGGEHKAIYELNDLKLNEFEVTFKKIEDSIISDVSPLLNTNLNIVKKFIKLNLIKFGFYATCESKSEFDSIKPWVLVVRGSYNLLPTKEFISFLNKKLNYRVEKLSVSDVIVHYRLGDLMTLVTKSPINEEILFRQLNSAMKSRSIKSCTILSSDPDYATLKFKGLKSPMDISSRYATPMDVLKMGFASKVFLGTNSKISMWVVFIRINQGLKNNYLPALFKNIFIQSYEEHTISDYVTFY